MIDGSEGDGSLAAARSGDGQAVVQLFHELHPRLTRFVAASEPRVADDIVGEVWLAIARGIANFEGDERAFRAWAFSIARRRIADHRRTNIRHKTDLTAPEGFDALTASDETAQQAVDQLTGQEAARLVVTILPAEQAEVILLRVLADMEVDEVALVVGRSSNWVRVTQHRALRKLADRVGHSAWASRSV
ncbi:MAG: RNA polymerase sigma factor [Ilumatobacteraceae bacterium]